MVSLVQRPEQLVGNVREYAWNEVPPRITAEWRELTRQGACAQPFYQPEWFQAFTSSFGLADAAILLAASRGETPVGILPLMRTKSFFRGIPAATLRSLSNVHSSRFDLIHNGEDRDFVASALWGELAARQDWDVIEFLDLPAEGSLRHLMRLAALDGYPVAEWPTRKMPRLPLSSDPRAPFSVCPEAFKGSRSRLAGKLRKLEGEGSVRFDVSGTGSEALLREFLALEASGWKGANGSAIACHPRVRSFYTSIAQHAEADNTLRIYTMRLNGKPIAMHLGLLSNGAYYIPKVAYDEEFRRYSPGLLLTKHVIEDLTKIGVRMFDFLGPRMEWKSVWTADHNEHANCYVFRKSLKGRALHTLMTRVAPQVRAMKHRIKGDPQHWERG